MTLSLRLIWFSVLIRWEIWWFLLHLIYLCSRTLQILLFKNEAFVRFWNWIININHLYGFSVKTIQFQKSCWHLYGFENSTGTFRIYMVLKIQNFPLKPYNSRNHVDICMVLKIQKISRNYVDICTVFSLKFDPNVLLQSKP